MESLYIEEYDAFVRWHRLGHGRETLLCLPGLNMPASWVFLDLATHPALQGRTILLFDCFGSGDSDPSPWFPGTLEAHVGVLETVLEYLGGRAATVLGHSMGGTLGIALALERPDLVARLVVAEANLTPGGGGSSRRFAEFSREEFEAGGLARTLDKLRGKAIAGDWSAALVHGAWRLADPGALHANARALVDLPLDFAWRFLDLPMPRAFIYGQRTCPATPEAAGPDTPDPAWLRSHGVTTHVVPEAGHMMLLENPVGFVAALGEAGLRLAEAPSAPPAS